MKFKPGDVVIKISGYEGYPKTSRYNIPAYPLEVKEASLGFVQLYVQGTVSPPLNDEFFELCEYKAKPLKRGTVWVNVYGTGLSLAYDTKRAADRKAESDRIACIEVPWVEGQGL